MALSVPSITKTQNFTVRDGDSFRHTFYVKKRSDGSAVAFGVGSTARMIFSAAGESPSVVLELTTSAGDISLTQASGQIDVVSPAGIFDSWSTLSYELEVTHGDGSVQTYFDGTFTMEAALD